LNNVSHSQILEAYAKFIDAGRLEIIAVGNFSLEGLAQKAQEVFGGLSSSWEEKTLLAQAKPIAKNSLRVKIKHTFLTDISADKAGPRPAVLIPTTDFADPVQYWFNAPQSQKERALYDALFVELHSLCQTAFASSDRYQKMSARIEERSPLVDFGAITFFNVQYVSDADAILDQALERLKEELSQSQEPGQGAALDKIKSLWLVKAFEGADQNLNAARLMAKKIDLARAQEKEFDAKNSQADDYEAVTKACAADFAAVFDAFFAKRCKLYSDAAKK
jgi:zinc protease